MPFSPNPLLQSLHPYIPGEQPQEAGFIKLNTNELPYPAAPEVLEAIRRAATDDIRLYPSPRCDTLRERLARHHGVQPENIFVGNGSDEVLRLLIQAYGGPGRVVATVEPSYSLFKSLIQASGSDNQVFLLNELERLPDSLFDSSWDLLLLPLPNPPLGTFFSERQVESLENSGIGLIVLDEAYMDFAHDSKYKYFTKMSVKFVLTRTFSKSYGLAGLRVGYMIADPSIIHEVLKIADSYNVNRISQTAALAALDAQPYYTQRVSEICRDRDWLASELKGRGFEVPPSEANFIFAKHKQAKILYERLKEVKILVRYFGGKVLPEGIRISIGTRPELEALLAALDTLL